MKLLHDLPDDCLRLIFYRVPLSDRMYLHHVCPRWASLQSSVTSTIKSLTLNIEATENEYAEFESRCTLSIPHLERIDASSDLCKFAQLHTLTFPTLTPYHIAQLTNLLPNIESLQVNTKTLDLTCINQLLLYWSDKIVKFEFNCWDYECLVDHDVCADSERAQLEEHAWICCRDVFALLEILNAKCLQLEHLTVDFRSYFEHSHLECSKIGFEIRKIEFTCLARVRVFRFSSNDEFRFLFNCLRPYALENDQLRHLVIENSEDDEEFDRIISAYPTLMNKISVLSSILESTKTSALSKWTNLATLPFFTINLFNFTKVLAKLTNLVHLKLFVNRNSLAIHQRTPSYRFRRLPSVKIIYLSTEAPTKLRSKHWAWIFPKVELIIFRQVPRSHGRGLNRLPAYPVPDEEVWHGEEPNEDVKEEDYEKEDDYHGKDGEDEYAEYDEEMIKEKTNKMYEQLQPLIMQCASLKWVIIAVAYFKDETHCEKFSEFKIDH